MMKELSVLLIPVLMLAACQKRAVETSTAAPAAQDVSIKKKLAQYAPVTLKWDPATLPEGDRLALKKLIEAGKVIDELYYLQVHPKMLEWFGRLPKGPMEKFFRLNAGPWDRLGGNKPVHGYGEKPRGGGLYPFDMTKDEFEKALTAHPEWREAFAGYFTIIVREGGTLNAVPYSQFYHDRLAKAAGFLKEAAALVTNESLKIFLTSRADAFLSNDYFQSDMDWMDVAGSPLEVTIGPYETYEDELFGYKAFFEAFVSIVDPKESAKLAFVQKELAELDRSFPYPKEFKGQPKGLECPIQVVNLVFNAGEAKGGVQTIAYNLPNDERVVAKKGSKKIMLKNVIEAKYEAMLKPIAKALLAEEMLPYVTPDAFFNHVLFHEISHGLGPGIIYLKDGTQTTVRDQMQDIYSGFEEAKADVGGVHCINFLSKKKIFPRQFKEEVAATDLASMFRTLRFGLHEAHGKGVLMQFNFLLERGAVNRTEAGFYQLDPVKFYEAMGALMERLIALQSNGDYDAAKAFMERYSVVPPHMDEDLAKLKELPVDIDPQFQLEF